MRHTRYILAVFTIASGVDCAVADDIPSADMPAHVTATGTNIVTLDTVRKFSPHARVDVVQELVGSWSEANQSGINSFLRVQHFFSEIAVETGGMTILEENLNYTAGRLKQVWPTRFTDENAAEYAGNPVKLANFVYGGRLGNKQGTNDGWDYRGSGLIQLTGRANFRKRGEALGLDGQLEQKPDLVRQPPMAFKAAYAYWAACGANPLADKDDTRAVRKAVNGGTTGLSTAQLWLVRAKQAFRPTQLASESEVIKRDEDVAVLSRLQELGYTRPAGTESLSNPQGVQQGLKDFQRANGLPATGALDDDTFYKLTDPQTLPKE